MNMIECLVANFSVGRVVIAHVQRRLYLSFILMDERHE